jgi:hypothetical protein
MKMKKINSFKNKRNFSIMEWIGSRYHLLVDIHNENNETKKELRFPSVLKNRDHYPNTFVSPWSNQQQNHLNPRE